MEKILEELKEIEARVSALIRELESPNEGITANVGEIRRLAVLEEIFRLGREATPEEISVFAQKFGKDPRSSSGYFSGKSPSLKRSENGKKRVLTPTGINSVMTARQQWGTDWLERIPLDIVGNASTPDLEITF